MTIKFICQVCRKEEEVSPSDAIARIEDNRATTCEGCNGDEEKARTIAGRAAQAEYDTVFNRELAGLRAARLRHG